LFFVLSRMSQEQQQTTIFSLQNDHYKNVLYYEISEEGEQVVDEECLVKYLKSNELINSFYIVNEKKNMIIVLKDKTYCVKIKEFINEYKDVKLNQAQLPFAVSLVDNPAFF
jgi:hypothetical protein